MGEGLKGILTCYEIKVINSEYKECILLTQNI